MKLLFDDQAMKSGRLPLGLSILYAIVALIQFAYPHSVAYMIAVAASFFALAIVAIVGGRRYGRPTSVMLGWTLLLLPVSFIFLGLALGAESHLH